MGQFQNILRGNIFIWFIMTLLATIFVIIKIIKNQIDIKDQVGEQKYRQGEAKRQAQMQSLERFDIAITTVDKPVDDDTIIEKWLKKGHQFQVYYMPVLFPFALNVMTGSNYVFLIIMFFLSLFFFLLFNLWKFHRQCVQHPVLRVILENLSYFISFFLLLNVWPTGTNQMPYYITKA